MGCPEMLSEGFPPRSVTYTELCPCRYDCPGRFDPSDGRRHRWLDRLRRIKL